MTTTANPKPAGFNALFVIHQFEVKSLASSAGYMEVARPMINSGFLNQHKIIPYGSNSQHPERIIQAKVEKLQKQWGVEPVVIYGAGAHTRMFLPLFKGLNVVALSDRDASLWGKEVEGLEVLPPSQVPYVASRVLVSSRAYEASIIEELTAVYAESVELAGLYDDLAGCAEIDLARLIDQALSDFVPDLLVYTPTHPKECLTSRYFGALKKRFPSLKLVNIWWDYDEQAEHSSYLDYERDCLLYSDFIIENSNATRLKKMYQKQAPYEQHQHVEKVHFHPTVFDASLFYRDLDVTKTVDVALWGSSVGERQKWITLLAEKVPGFRQFGGVYRSDQPLSAEEYAAWYRKTKIAVNTQTYPFRSQCKGKVREALCSGTFLLEEDNPQTREFVPEGKGVVYFKDKADLLEKINYYLTHEDEREMIAAAGYEWMKKHHNEITWTARILHETGLLDRLSMQTQPLAG